MSDLILIQLGVIIYEDFWYTDDTLSQESILGKDCRFDELDIVNIINKLEEEMDVKFTIVDIPQEVLEMTLLEFSEYLNDNLE